MKPAITIDEEFRALIPPLTPEELAGLELSLKHEGCRDALVIWNGVLLDGHNRYEICQREGLVVHIKEIELADRSAARVWIISNQFARRNITLATRCRLAKALAVELKIKAKVNQNAALESSPKRGGKIPPKLGKPIDALKDAAKQAGVSHGSLSAYEYVEKNAEPEELAKLQSDPNLKLHSVAKDVRNRNKKQAHAALVKRVAKEKKDKPAEAPQGPFDIILADPPWKYEHCEANNREIENHYPTMTLDEIFKDAPNVKDDAILFLWATAPKLAEAMQVIEKWGFVYRSGAVWDKEVIGMGYWFRIQHEHLLVAVKGKPKAPPESERVSSLFHQKRGKHSVKPDFFLEWIERAYPLAVKCEMYCRKPRAGWAAWGNEV